MGGTSAGCTSIPLGITPALLRRAGYFIAKRTWSSVVCIRVHGMGLAYSLDEAHVRDHCERLGDWGWGPTRVWRWGCRLTSCRQQSSELIDRLRGERRAGRRRRAAFATRHPPPISCSRIFLAPFALLTPRRYGDVNRGSHLAAHIEHVVDDVLLEGASL
jgi:hypothetical protein